ncbi:MAG: 3-hydroxybutyryl-CoA dehydrogenase, partial [Deltaproteobacteria bacterium]|nr:3-hydroxybutyryl-CoA dehydrogenase [Deltaproteobacteria bacterium]
MSSGIRKVGVVGIGLMGSGIAQVAASQEFNTVVVDVTAEIIERGMERIRGSLQRLVESHQKSAGKTGVPPEEKEKILRQLRPSTERQELLDRDIVIEAMVENERAKKEMIASLAEMGYQGLFVSNTSSISITRLASAYPWPEKFMGMHFMNP